MYYTDLEKYLSIIYISQQIKHNYEKKKIICFLALFNY